MNKLKLLPLLFLFFIAEGCAPYLIDLSKAKASVREYYETGKYDEDLQEIIDDAIKDFSSIAFDSASAAIFDVDETALSNYKHIKEVDFGYIPKLWDEWVDEVEAPAIPGVKKLYDFLLSKGVRIIFITGRKDYQYKATYENLIKEGYTIFDTLITKQPDEYKLNAVTYKSDKRTALTEKGYSIKGNIGDQHSDLEGPYCGIKVKLPNYLYSID